jgi:hypothetical protein
MMKILKFTGQLVDLMGLDARKNWEKDCGLRFSSGHQNAEEETTLMEVIDEEKTAKYFALSEVEVLTVGQANLVIAEKMDKTIFRRYDDALYGANIQKKIADGSLDIDLMQPDWTDQQELEFLYNAGVSGIKRQEFVAPRFVE